MRLGGYNFFGGQEEMTLANIGDKKKNVVRNLCIAPHFEFNKQLF